ncbi:MAG: DNA polymerase III subunit delta' [Halanaerobiales bacterium]
MSFDKIPGQEAAIRILKDELDSGRIHHAYLFTGKEGVGKERTALEFTKAVLCEEEGVEACDKCLACRKIEHSNHPDVRIIDIDEDANNIKIDQVRELQKDMSYKPYDSSRKVYIITEADRMTPEAANSLLKTLEEPPEYGILILLARELDKLLPTVISRCQRIQFHTIKDNIIEEELQNSGYSEEKSRLIARLAEGSLGRANSLLEDEDFFENRKSIIETLYNLPELNAVEIFKQVDFMMSILKNKEGFPLFYLILSWYRDIILYNQGYDREIVNFDYQEWISLQDKYYSLEGLVSIVELVTTTKNYVERNVKNDLALQVLLFKIRAKRVK